ncbi:mitochondrial carrier domain-containing protein, partial [Lyophyllum atratum]
HGSKELDTSKRLARGALAGITSVCSTYPLDLVRSRLSIATASVALAATPVPSSSSLASTATNGHQRHLTAESFFPSLHIVRLNTQTRCCPLPQYLPVLSCCHHSRLYRDLVTTAVGAAPYVGINFAAYEFPRGIVTPPGKSSVWRKLSCGALAGTISQTLTYPFDVLRQKMQVMGMKGGSIKYNGALHALRSIIHAEGLVGLYRGLWPNLLKVAPSIATLFFTYELVKDLLLPS